VHSWRVLPKDDVGCVLVDSLRFFLPVRCVEGPPEGLPFRPDAKWYSRGRLRTGLLRVGS
jgi:hypothetical protein